MVDELPERHVAVDHRVPLLAGRQVVERIGEHHREGAVDLADTVARDRAFYGDRGGVTLSGGEPTFQAKGALALLRVCRKANIGTAVETCGAFPAKLLEKLVPLVDLFLWDVKDTDTAGYLYFQKGTALMIR